jgi:hypothetical protein
MTVIYTEANAKTISTQHNYKIDLARAVRTTQKPYIAYGSRLREHSLFCTCTNSIDRIYFTFNRNYSMTAVGRRLRLPALALSCTYAFPRLSYCQTYWVFGRKQIQFPKCRVSLGLFFNTRTMDIVRKLNISESYTPSSESYSNYTHIYCRFRRLCIINLWKKSVYVFLCVSSYHS